MAMNSNTRKSAPLRTYSKRVHTSNEESPFKKQRIEEPPIAKLPPPLAKAKSSSIQSYFKPLPTSSSPPSTRSIQESSDPTEPSSTPPSSPPLRSHSPPGLTGRAQKRLRRRLTTRPPLVPIIKMSSLPNTVPRYGEDEDCQKSARRSTISGPSTLTEPVNFQVGSNVPCTVATAVSPTNATLDSKQSDGLKEPGSDQADLIAIPSPHSKPKPKPQSFEQQQLDLGIPAMTVCRDCGMHYNRTLRDDRYQHESFHKSVVRGKAVKLNTAKVVLMEKVVDGRQHRIQVIDRRESCEWRVMAEDALKHSLRDLPGVLPEEIPLWSEISNPSCPDSSVKVPRYKIYIYTIQLEVVAIVLAERISEGGAYYYGPMTHDEDGKWPTEVPAPEQQEYASKDITYPVVLSIDRIWTRADHRREGFARILVDLAREEFVPGLVLSKKQVAFSLPTKMGRKFAAKYCGGVFPDAAFLINLSDCPTVVEDDRLVNQS